MPNPVQPFEPTNERPPFFFCTPATVPEEIRKKFGNSSNPVPWPPGTQLRVKVLDNEQCERELCDTIEGVSLRWLTEMDQRLSLVWVPSNEEAQIRISFQTDLPDWSAIGAQALQIDAKKPTMNFSFNDWDDFRTVNSLTHAERVAAHLFGHALGIPHAQAIWSSPWNDTMLEKRYGKILANIIRSDKGATKLQNPRSIMLFDRPPELCSGSGSGDRAGGVYIDNEAKAYLRDLYPYVWDVDWRRISVKHKESSTIKTTRTSNVITAPVLLATDGAAVGDVNASFLPEKIQQGSSIEVRGLAKEPMYGVSGHVLSFDPKDQRAQVGFVEYKDMTIAAAPASIASKPVNFKKEFSRPPKVVVFIASLSTQAGQPVRARVKPESIDAKGFVLTMGIERAHKTYNLGVYWFAHDPDEWSIRSGYFASEFKASGTKLETIYAGFDKPMVAKPRYIFTGFNFISINCADRLTIKIDISRDQDIQQKWDKNGVSFFFNAYDNLTLFYQLGGSYIAIF